MSIHVIESCSPSEDMQAEVNTPVAEIALVAAPPALACRACVVVPARDEAQSIAQTLAALAEQRDSDGRPLAPDTYEVILLANNCRDETVATARRFAMQRDWPALHVAEVTLPPDRAHVGMARRMAMDEAARRLASVGQSRGLVATTDADTVVAPTWLAAMLHEVERGAEAVGGRILVTDAELEAMAPAVRRRFLHHVAYASLAHEVEARIDPQPGDPWPSHEQFSGASLAVTVQAYRQVGGLPSLPSNEDVALGTALRRSDIAIRHSIDVRVFTSGRVHGRAPAGMADLLAGWATQAGDDTGHAVPSLATVVGRATGRRALRALWRCARTWRNLDRDEVASLATQAAVPERWLQQAILETDRLGTLIDEVERRSVWHIRPVLVRVEDAIADLQSWLMPYRRTPAAPATVTHPLSPAPSVWTPSDTRWHQLRLAPPAVLASREQVEPIPERPVPLAPPPQVA